MSARTKARRALAAVLRFVVPAADPHTCLLGGHRMRRLSAAQLAQLTQRAEPSCPYCASPMVRDAFLERYRKAFGPQAQALREQGPGWTEPIL